MGEIVLLILLTGLSFNKCLAQKVDNLASFRDIKSARYFRVYYDNDLFAGTDENYTQGYSFELVAPSLGRNPFNHLFYQPREAQTRFGLAVEHIAFTPAKYELAELQFGDRPFASCLMLKSFMIATNTVKSSRFTSSFNIGIIGPAALGEEIQVGIHKAIGNKIPLGWQHQIKNDLIINYQIAYEKQLLRYSELFSLQAEVGARFGTLFTNGSIGLNGTFGIINSPFSSIQKKNGFKLYIYAQPMLRLIGYDATLHGGVFNKESPYTIPIDEVERLTGQFNFGIVCKTKNIYFEYSHSLLTREIETGSLAKWGGLKIGFTF
ncbi:MAG: hypothetical protein Crog4KO_07960 [Crocinitomicaceae bacterium]